MLNYKLAKNISLVKNHDAVVQLIIISQTFLTVIIYDDDDDVVPPSCTLTFWPRELFFKF